MNEKVAQYHLPGLFEFYELYAAFLPLYRAHREYFYDWCDIGSIYGAPIGCLWGGGRVSSGTCGDKCGNNSGNKRSDYGKTHQHTRLLQRSRSRTDRNIQQRPCHPSGHCRAYFHSFLHHQRKRKRHRTEHLPANHALIRRKPLSDSREGDNFCIEI